MKWLLAVALTNSLLLIIVGAHTPRTEMTSENLMQAPVRTATWLYSKHCASCHGKDGRAKTMKSKMRYHARNLTDREWQTNASDERIFNSIVNGKGKMPAFSKKLTDAEVESLVKFVRAFGS